MRSGALFPWRLNSKTWARSGSLWHQACRFTCAKSTSTPITTGSHCQAQHAAAVAHESQRPAYAAVVVAGKQDYLHELIQEPVDASRLALEATERKIE